MNRFAMTTSIVLTALLTLPGCARFSRPPETIQVLEPAAAPNGLPRLIRTGPDDGEMVLIPAGYTVVGSYDEGEGPERPATRIWLPAFYIDKYEVTNAQYAKFLEYIDTHGDAAVRCRNAPEIVEYTPRYWDDENLSAPNLPVVGVDWYCAYAFARWAGKRLPTEFEWEKAARGPCDENADPKQTLRYPWGNEEPDADGEHRANYSKNGHKKPGADLDGYARTAPVDAFPNGVSPYGVYNLSGNANEWTDTFWDPVYYANMPKRNPRGPTNGEYRTVRGGSWKWRAFHIRSARRRKLQHKDRKSDLGFRLAMNADKAEKR